MTYALLRPARKRARRRAPAVAALVALVAAGLAAGQPAAAAEDPADPPVVADQPVKDADKATAIAAEPGTEPPAPRVSRVAPYTQDELRDRSHRRAVAQRQNVYTDADRLEAPEAAGATALAPGVDLPTRPLDHDVEQCTNADGARSILGRVHNRFLYCRQFTMSMTYVEIIDGVPVQVGITTLDYQLMAYASKQSRSVRVFLRTQDDAARYFWRQEYRAFAPLQHFDINVRCVTGSSPDPACSIGGGSVSHTAETWDDGVDWVSWDVESDEAGSAGTELVRRHEWQTYFQASPVDRFQTPLPGQSALRTLRCDSATYIRYQSKACIFDDVVPHLIYSTASKKQHDVAVHIREAQDDPNSTYPLVENPPRDKRIPGKYTGNVDDPALHRLPKGASQLKDNTDHKNAACYGTGPVAAQYVGRGLPTRPPTGTDCDEYPFRSTVEGAANPDWDFSVKAVNRSQNRSAGASLGIYLDADRILYRDADAFYVEIVDSGDPGEEPDPVVVDAGPDKTGNEGSDIYLEGRADAAEEDSVAWSYRAVSAVDPGTTCGFGDVHDPRSTFRCNDDGVFELTLTSDDGSDEAVSDTTQVTVRNVAPVWTRTGPESWTLYRVRTPVDLVAEFTDPGSNDTHTCLVRWDDGLEDESAASGSDCNRRHVFNRAGMFTIDAWATDDDGDDAHVKTMVVVYDPDAGWTNADGSGNAPAGTYGNRPTASGEGWFHLTARYYKPNDTKPVGTARAWLTPADFRFEAPGDTNLEWLVVTPDGKVAAKGRGTVNGNSGYGFLMYGYDGCLDGGAPGCQPGERDRFRTVVWQDYQNPSAFPLYDTYRDADYDVDRALPWTLASGRVTIQR